MLGDTPRPVAYLSKQLDNTASGWPPCLQAVVATCDLLKEAEKCTLDQPITICVPHQVLVLLEQKGGWRYWLTAGRMGKYQAILLDDSNVPIQTVSSLNPPTPLEEEVTLDCLEVQETIL